MTEPKATPAAYLLLWNGKRERWCTAEYAFTKDRHGSQDVISADV